MCQKIPLKSGLDFHRHCEDLQSNLMREAESCFANSKQSGYDLKNGIPFVCHNWIASNLW